MCEPRGMRSVFLLMGLVALGCGEDDGGSAGAGGGASTGGAGASGGGGGSTGGSAGSGGSGGSGGSAGSGGNAGSGGSIADAASDAPPAVCDFASPQPPPSGVLWAAPLAASGAGTLGGHGHDDGKGPVGFCAGTKLSGQPFYRLLAAGFETDDPAVKTGPLPVDFWKSAASFTGVGESGGRINVYVQIVDQSDKVLNVTTNPEIKIQKTILDGPTESLSLDSKPANEFQTNFPMTGGGTRYGAAIEGASDRVINMRLPVNHHVTYVLVFRRENG